MAFVDVLGFKALLARMTTHPILFETIRDSLDAVLAYETSLSQSRVLDAEYDAAGVRMTAFSDCYAISAKLGNENLLINVSRQLALCLLEAGILSRGAIVIGDLYHQERIVFGQGLVDAYELEQGAANYPRILVTDDIVARIRQIDSTVGTAHMEGLKQDGDGCWFVDPFFIWPTRIQFTDNSVSETPQICDSSFTANTMNIAFEDVFLRARGHIVEQLLALLRSSRPNLAHLAKIRWLAYRFNEAMAAKPVLRIRPIALDAPEHEPAWLKRQDLREGRSMLPIAQPFTLDDILAARRRNPPARGPTNRRKRDR